MLGRSLKKIAKHVRPLFHPTEWMIKLLGLKKCEVWDRRGLILIQLDGLGFDHLQKAFQNGNMPFLKKLKEREQYKKLCLFSGIPSSTPAVQGELFYGVKQCVPGFGFRDHKTGKNFKMYEAEAASMIERRLEEMGKGILSGGAAYGNIFAGGADEAMFCASSMGWRVLKKIHPWAFSVLLIFHIKIITRLVVLIVAETVLAFLDFFRGLLKGLNLRSELFFISTRVGVTIILRELIAARVKIDIARALPVIHMNFFGFDEHAHRRGPSSRFANWTLNGIDDCVRRIWTSAVRSPHRDYEIWIYSDHGQSDTLSYRACYGKKLEQVVTQLFKNRFPEKDPANPDCFTVTDMGPIGHVYIMDQCALGDEEKIDFARLLVNEGHIPVAFGVDQSDRTWACSDKGIFYFPEEAVSVLGQHPFLKETTQDLIELCHHPDAGQLVLFGWRDGLEPMTFPFERGGHGGIAPVEVTGFVLIPGNVPVQYREGNFLRPADLYQMVTRFFHPEFAGCMIARKREEDRLRVMTYNVHSCLGTDGRVSVERIAKVIARAQADIIGLQELDRYPLSSGGGHQLQRIAETLDAKFIFHPVRLSATEEYGIGVISRYPVRLVKAELLSMTFEPKFREPRGALWVEIDLGYTKLQMITTHLGLSKRERIEQLEDLEGDCWLRHPQFQTPAIFVGDFNTLPGSPLIGKIANQMNNIREFSADIRNQKTWPSRFPFFCLDYVFFSRDMEVLNAYVVQSDLARVASDHLPVVADLKLTTHPQERDHQSDPSCYSASRERM